jgi:hypothetical protein
VLETSFTVRRSYSRVALRNRESGMREYERFGCGLSRCALCASMVKTKNTLSVLCASVVKNSPGLGTEDLEVSG